VFAGKIKGKKIQKYKDRVSSQTSVWFDECADLNNVTEIFGVKPTMHIRKKNEICWIDGVVVLRRFFLIDPYHHHILHFGL
jgi:hypothetical protein